MHRHPPHPRPPGSTTAVGSAPPNRVCRCPPPSPTAAPRLDRRVERVRPSTRPRRRVCSTPGLDGRRKIGRSFPRAARARKTHSGPTCRPVPRRGGGEPCPRAARHRRHSRLAAPWPSPSIPKTGGLHGHGPAGAFRHRVGASVAATIRGVGGRVSVLSDPQRRRSPGQPPAARRGAVGCAHPRPSPTGVDVGTTVPGPRVAGSIPTGVARVETGLASPRACPPPRDPAATAPLASAGPLLVTIRAVAWSCPRAGGTQVHPPPSRITSLVPCADGPGGFPGPGTDSGRFLCVSALRGQQPGQESRGFGPAIVQPCRSACRVGPSIRSGRRDSAVAECGQHDSVDATIEGGHARSGRSFPSRGSGRSRAPQLCGVPVRAGSRWSSGAQRHCTASVGA